MSQTKIWWIRRDIRLNDNQTLHAALNDADSAINSGSIMNEGEAKSYNFKLGEDYPERIVDHKFARQRTLDAYKTARSN